MVQAQFLYVVVQGVNDADHSYVAEVELDYFGLSLVLGLDLEEAQNVAEVGHDLNLV